MTALDAPRAERRPLGSVEDPVNAPDRPAAQAEGLAARPVLVVKKLLRIAVFTRLLCVHAAALCVGRLLLPEAQKKPD